MKPSRLPASAALTLILLFAIAAALWAGADEIELDAQDARGSFYPVEQDRSGARFRWSRERSLVHFRGIDRTQGVRFKLEVRGWRSDGVELTARGGPFP